jgi:hypothetical protein
MANAGNANVQLDASKSSKMYCGGRFTTFRHSYEAFCNLRLLLSVMVEDVTAQMVLQKLLEYVTLLVDQRGRTVFEINSQKPHLAVHPWQDIQHILSAFLSVATGADLYNTISRGGDVGLANYANALAVAD